MDMDAKSAGMNDRGLAIQQAEQWFARLLDSACTASDRQAFERWRRASPAHQVAYRQVEQVWSLSARAIQRDATLMALARQVRYAPAAHPRQRRILPALAAAAAITVAVLLVWTTHQQIPAGTDYRTAVGEQRTILLNDGTHIVLDTHSEVRVRYNDRVRRVDLLRGRVQFNVRANKQRPFVVHARDGTVTDIGTRFQIDLRKSVVNVTLLEGRVAIATEADGKMRHAALAPGQQLDYGHAGAISPARPADVKLATGWTHGKLFVHDWPLWKMLAAVNRYNVTPVVIGDPSLRHLRISGVFHVHDRKMLLRVLEQGWSLKATRTPAGRIVLSREKLPAPEEAGDMSPQGRASRQR